MPYFPMTILRYFLRFLLIPSRSSIIYLVVEDEDMSLPDSFFLVLGWIGKDCGDTFFHAFVPPSFLHEFHFMILYDIMTSLTHVLFLLDLSLF
jgi:hypothetical protein